MQIQWFPGHMAKTRRELEESITKVDLVAELADARIPDSSRNPVLDELVGNKPRILVLTRRDQADPQETERWLAYYRATGLYALAVDAKSGSGCQGFAPLAREALAEKIERWNARGMKGAHLKIMVVGIPNVGKSSFINRLSGRAAVKAEDRPGVTRQKQWIRLSGGLDLLDTPGMLWPKLEEGRVGEHLAFTGAIRDDILDLETLAARLLALLAERAPALVAERFGITDGNMSEVELLETAARRRGFLIKGGEIDGERTARVLLDEYRGGKLGRITLEPASAEPTPDVKGE